MRLVILTACAALAACTHVQVADVGNGRHCLTAVSPSGGYSGSHEEAIGQANEYCRRWQQAAVLEEFQDKPGVGPHGEHTSNLVFDCAPPPVLHF